MESIDGDVVDRGPGDLGCGRESLFERGGAKGDVAGGADEEVEFVGSRAGG